MNIDDRANVMRKLDEGRWLLAVGRPRDAVAPLREALRMDPDHFDARLAEAQARLLLNEPVAALHALHALELCHPAARAMPLPAELRGRAYLMLGQPALATAAVEPMLAHCPGDARFHRLLAEAAMQLGREEGAIKHLRDAVACEPGDVPTRRQLSSLLAKSNPQAAAKCLELPLQFDDGPTSFERADLLIKAGRDADARQMLERLAANAGDGDPAVLLALAGIAERQGAVASALSCLKGVTRDRKHRAAALTAMMHVLLRSGRTAEAAISAWRLARSGNEAAPAWGLLIVCGLVLRRDRLVQLAQRRLQQLVGPTEARSLVAFVWTFTAMGQVVAPRDGNAATEQTPSRLARLLQHTADVLDRQAAIKPDWADSFYHAAACHAAIGHTVEATQRVQAALDINPHYNAAAVLAGRLPHLERLAA